MTRRTKSTIVAKTAISALNNHSAQKQDVLQSALHKYSSSRNGSRLERIQNSMENIRQQLQNMDRLASTRLQDHNLSSEKVGEHLWSKAPSARMNTRGTRISSRRRTSEGVAAIRALRTAEAKNLKMEQNPNFAHSAMVSACRRVTQSTLNGPLMRRYNSNELEEYGQETLKRRTRVDLL
eukprot:m.20106 g.20106  ORF g.20106 m.20106 type:complete len:180 (+) comp6752_c0_seq1:82-621(+)